MKTLILLIAFTSLPAIAEIHLCERDKSEAANHLFNLYTSNARAMWSQKDAPKPLERSIFSDLLANLEGVHTKVCLANSASNYLVFEKENRTNSELNKACREACTKIGTRSPTPSEKPRLGDQKACDQACETISFHNDRYTANFRQGYEESRQNCEEKYSIKKNFESNPSGAAQHDRDQNFSLLCTESFKNYFETSKDIMKPSSFLGTFKQFCAANPRRSLLARGDSEVRMFSNKWLKQCNELCFGPESFANGCKTNCQSTFKSLQTDLNGFSHGRRFGISYCSTIQNTDRGGGRSFVPPGNDKKIPDVDVKR